MLRFYSPILILQIFCFYHVYNNSRNWAWVFLIMFLPLFGSLFYLYKQFYSRKNIDIVSEGIKTNIISNYKIDKLEKELKYSDTVYNKIILADEHLASNNIERASELYRSCLKSEIHKNDTELVLKVMKTSYLLKDYQTVIEQADKINKLKEFQNSEEKIALAWAYHYKGEKELADRTFQEMDVRFSNYLHRVEYAKFLNEIKKKEKGKEILVELLDEIESMDNTEKRQKKDIYRSIKNYYKQL